MTNKLAPQKLCSGCLSCKDAFKKNAINITHSNGVMYPVVYEDLCVDCHACENSCPILTPIKLNNVEEIQVFGGWAKDDDVRINAASGGAFSAFAQSFLRKHPDEAVVVGASLVDGTHVEHIMINREDDITLLRNSKYVQSIADGI